jgi:hypothetical protein
VVLLFIFKRLAGKTAFVQAFWATFPGSLTRIARGMNVRF